MSQQALSPQTLHRTAMHGGDLKSFSEQFNKKESQILDFSSNVNPLGCPASVQKTFPELSSEFSLYPDTKAREFRQEASRGYPLWPENVLAGNGSLALLALAIRTLAPKKALLIEPCFSQYRQLLNLQKSEIWGILSKENDQFQFRIQEIMNGLRGVDFMIIGHPNNPTGTGLERRALLDILEEAHRLNVFVIVDETYADWDPENSVARDVKDNAYFLVIRSLTEFYGLAAIRSAYALGSKRLIQKMGLQQGLWACNRVAQRLSVAALRDMDFEAKSLKWYREEKTWFRNKLESLGAFKVYPSRSNFFLVKIKIPVTQLDLAPGAGPAQNLFEFLGKKGIFIRTAQDFTGLDSTFFRVAIRQRKHNETLIRQLRSWLKWQQSEQARPVLRPKIHPPSPQLISPPR